MFMKVNYVTAQGLERLEQQLHRLREEKYHPLLEQLRDVSEGGYTIDNTELITLQAQLEMLESQIQTLEDTLRSAQVIAPQQGATAVVTIGSTVTVQEDGFDPETFFLVGPAEADPTAGYISNESPLGRMLLGKKVGATITIMSPDGPIPYKLLAIR
jgi:transcription elongation factor GreA